MTLFISLACFLIGFIVPYYYFRLKSQQAASELTYLKNQNQEKDEKLHLLENKRLQLIQELAYSKARSEAQAESFDEKSKLLEAAKTNLTDAFNALSAKALQNNNQAFLNLAQQTLLTQQKTSQLELEKRQQAIAHFLSPMQKSLDSFNERIHQFETTRISAFTALEEGIKHLSTSQMKLESETRNLAKALRTPHVRGQWGELQLKRTVELAGMQKYVDFNQQQTQVTDADSKVQRPDMVIHLPNGRQIAIDAKVPLMAYLEAIEAESPQLQKEKLKKHAQHLHDHMLLLSSKQYWKELSPELEFVILFLPGEGFLSAALELDQRLIEIGSQNKVLLASPTTLIALLKAVAAGWQENNVAKEAQQISELASQLYERIATVAEHLDDLRKGLERTVNCYNKAVSSIESRVLTCARKFKDLHVQTNKEIPIINPIDKLPIPALSPELSLAESIN